MSPRMRRRLPLATAMLFNAALLLSPLVSRGLVAPFAPRGALAGLVCGAALACFLARLLDRRAAAYGVAALTTMPLFFVVARARPGDAVAMAAGSVAFAGLALAALDRRRGETRAARLGPLALGVLGLVAGGLASGALLGVATPALGVGLAWALLGPRRHALADTCGALTLATGTVAAAAALALGPPITAAAHPTFDVVLRQLGHALFPWSALLPLTWLALLSPPSRRGALAFARDEAARVVVLTSAAVAFAAHALRGAPPFTAPAVLAAALAIAARDLDRRGATPARAGLRDPRTACLAGITAALLTALLARDLLDAPARALTSILPPHAGAEPTAAAASLRASAVVFASVAALAGFALRRHLGISRGQAVIGAGALAGALLAWGYYPALLAHAPEAPTLSPPGSPQDGGHPRDSGAPHAH